MDTPRFVRATVTSVKRRKCPTAQTLAEYVTLRVGDSRLGEALQVQFAKAIEGKAMDHCKSVSAYSRLFSSAGVLTAHDWRAVARMTVHLVRSQSVSDGSAPARVKSLLSTKTALRYARRYLRASWYDAMRLLGWEWVLEKALRVARYIQP